ncbi:CHAT domain-containing protein [Streptomyces sp. NPDC005393]|uniref:CHAT domain-containing tetratricopeptide repeat protein n=1 Tax=Streptomyces sp. NPDC005393 TaxID=3157041 RepID=UPI0033BD037D
MLFAVAGAHHQLLGDSGLAQSLYERAAEHGSTDAMNNLGVLLKQQGRLDEAERWLRRAAATGDPDAANNLARTLHERGELEEAVVWFERAFLVGDDPDVLGNLTMTLLTLGREDEARRLLEAAGERGDPLAAGLASALVDRADEPRERPPTAPEPDPADALAEDTAGPGPAVTIDPTDPLASADGLRLAYARSGDPQLLELALDMCRLAVQTYRAYANPARHALALSTLGVLLRMRHERDRSPEPLAEAVEVGRAAVAASSREDPEYARHLSGLANSLQEMFEQTGDLAVIDEAIALYRTCLSVVPAAHPEHTSVQTDFGNCLLCRARHSPDPAVLDEAILAGRAAVRGTPPGHPRHPVVLTNLGAALLQYAITTVNLAALDEAIETYERALEAFPSGHPACAQVREALDTCARARRAVHRERGTTPRPGGARRGAPAGAAAELREAAARHAAYERTGSLPDLERAVAGFESVMRSATDAEPRSAAANGLGISMWSRYERGSDRRDLDRAIDLFADALAMGPQEDPEAPAMRANLSGVLRLRWLLTGDGDDLTAAVELSRAVLAATRPDDPRRSWRLSGLGGGLLGLFLHHRDSSALAEAVQIYRQALAAVVPGDAGTRAKARSNLGEALRQQAGLEGAGAEEALDEAVELARAALAAMPADRLLHPRFESNLSIALHQRFTARADPDDLREAAAAARRAVAATPADHPNRAERLSILAQVLQLDFERRRDASALDVLIVAAEAAADAAPPGHRLRAQALTLHAHALGVRAVVEHEPAALAAAQAVHRELAHDPTAAVSARVRAAQRWAFTALTAGDWPRALEPFALAVELLPRTAPRRIGQADRERQLAGFAGLASDAAACAIRLGDPERALRLLEQGRGVLLAQALDARTALAGLREHHPGLAHRFEELRAALDRPEESVFSSAGTVAGRPDATAGSLRGEDRHALAEEWERLTLRIRQQPGFEWFLHPPEVAELLAATGGAGPVVIVNVSRLRCDALVLTDREVRAVPLPALHHDEVVQRADAFFPAVRTAGDGEGAMADRFTAQGQVRETLEWLWTALAEPVLDALGLTGRRAKGGPRAGPKGAKDAALPRLWWIPTGPLTALPLHAAGRHDAAGRPADSVLDRVVSSYAPTVRGLARAARRGAGDRAPGPVEPLVVALPVTPGAPELSGARQEAAAVTGRLPDTRVLTGERARRDVVLDMLPRHRWAHFACHAVSAVGDLSSSHVLLYDHRKRPLAVADIARLDLGGAELAYLSACETTRARQEPADEAVHLTGAFHIAGYAHVIGTLWTVDDEAAARIAEDFYAALTASGAAGAQGAARALHGAVRGLRDTYPMAPTLWATHIHVGA